MGRRAGLVEEALTRSVIGAFYTVYNRLGYGFLEHVYSLALERELIARGHRVAREVSVVIWYNNEPLTTQRVDMLVDEKLVVENKSTAVLHPFAARQLYNYLRATDLEIGLLLHYGPEPKFQRLISTNVPRTDPPNPAFPPNPQPDVERPLNPP